MPRFLIPVLSLLLASGVVPAAAQDSDASQAFQRAAALVRDGQGEEGRRIVDSLFVRAREGTPGHAEALYWRAALARDAQQAERDYRQLVVNYPFAAYTDRALLALAQIELARNDRERAIAHLQRLEREHPNGDTRAVAAFWMARVRFDMNDEPRACAALDEAQRRAPESDAELRNQIEFLATRCVGVARADSASAGRATASRPATDDAPAESGASERPRTAPAASGTSQRSRTASSPAAGSRRSASFAVQVAAYDTRADAEALVKRLARRDIAARVVGTKRPFRVWTGNYATRSEATAAQRKLRERSIHGFVVQQPAAP